MAFRITGLARSSRQNDVRVELGAHDQAKALMLIESDGALVSVEHMKERCLAAAPDGFCQVLHHHPCILCREACIALAQTALAETPLHGQKKPGQERADDNRNDREPGDCRMQIDTGRRLGPAP